MRKWDIPSRLSAHDTQGMDEFLRQYGPMMRYIIAPILPDAHDAEDALSEAAMRIWERIDTFDETKGSFAAWVTAVTRHTALNLLRNARRRQTEEIPEESVSTEATPEEQLLEDELKRTLASALATLSREERTLFYRKYYYRQSTAKIAAEMGWTVRAVEGRLYRIKKKLRKKLGGDPYETR